MKYTELEANLRGLVEVANEKALERAARTTVTRAVESPIVGDIDEAELDVDGWASFRALCLGATTAPADELRERFLEVDAGVLTDGDMDPGLIIVLNALEHWITFLETSEPDAVFSLVIDSMEEIDYRVSADTRDFLAHPELAAEYDRISRALAG